MALSSRTPPDGINNSAGWSGLETERVCELVVTGSEDSVDLARVRLLVMLDELVSFKKISLFFQSVMFIPCLQSGLHSEVCEIDHKLHAIVSGRKRSVLQSIQEDTATNIYLPSPLQGLMGPDLTTSATPPTGSSRNSNVIWITGEFFGVQRARDMLFSVSLNKVRFYFTGKMVSSYLLPEQVCYLKRHSYSSSQAGLDGYRPRGRSQIHYERQCNVHSVSSVGQLYEPDYRIRRPPC